jgi:flagellar protein FlaI
MADGASLSDRLKDLKLREVGDADPAQVARALASKATLSERMKEMLLSELEARGPPAAKVSAAERVIQAAAEAAAAKAGEEVTDEKAGITGLIARPKRDLAFEQELDKAAFMRRLRALQAAEEAAQSMPEEAFSPQDERKRAFGWFLGRGGQSKGQGLVTAVPKIDKAKWIERDFYEVEAPYSFVRILQSRTTAELVYEVIEPKLGEPERQILTFITDALVRGLSTDPGALKPEERTVYLMRAVREIIADYRIRLNALEQQRIEYYVRRDFLGLGPIHAVMVDPNIEDISCDGAAQPLFIFHRQYESIASTIRFASEGELDGFVIRIAQRSGKAISISDPILDAALPDGSRLQATLGREVTQNGSTFTIRRFKADPFTPLDLVRFGTLSVDLLAWFWMIVQYGYSLIFSGGTASGKTTGLNAISQFIPQSAKVVSIEDTREINLPHDNWIKAVTRSGSTVEGTGEIGMFELLKASLRQRPEYILVGEVRGIEATVAFQAMATGHTVYSTMHADSARSVVYRLENDPINIPRLVLQALDVIAIQAQTRIQGKRVRRIMEVVELVGMDPSTKELLTNTVFKWDSLRDQFDYAGRSYMLERIAEERNWSPAQLAAEFERRKRILQRMMERGVRDVRELTDIVKAYYRDPDALDAALSGADA